MEELCPHTNHVVLADIRETDATEDILQRSGAELKTGNRLTLFSACFEEINFLREL